MIILDSVNDKVQAVLGGAVTTNQLQCYAAWRDVTTTAYTPGKTTTLTNNTTDVDIGADDVYQSCGLSRADNVGNKAPIICGVNANASSK